MKKIINYYESRHEYKALEKVIMKIDVNEYPFLKEELVVVC